MLDVPVAILLYVLLRRVGRTVSLIAASFRLVYTAIVSANLLNQLGAGLLLSDADYLSAFETAQVHALALYFLDLQQHGYSLALIFFGVHLIILGVLLSKASYFPKFLGIVIVLGGLAYLTDSITALVLPAVNATIAPFLWLPLSAELLLALWLLIKGVKDPAARA